MSLRKAIALSIVLLAFILIFFEQGERVKRGDTDYLVEDRIELGNGRSILILTSDEAFETPAWYYEVHVNGQIIVPMTFLYGACCSDDKYEVLSSRDNNVVGLVLTKRPNELIAAHNFASGASWPRGRDTDTILQRLERGRTLRDVLQADNPPGKLILSDEVSGPTW